MMKAPVPEPFFVLAAKSLNRLATLARAARRPAEAGEDEEDREAAFSQLVEYLPEPDGREADRPGARPAPPGDGGAAG